MVQNSSKRSIYIDAERHSSFQRIRHGYIERPQEQLSTGSDEVDLDLELHRAFVQSQSSPENVQQSPTDDHDYTQSRHIVSSLARRDAPRILRESDRNLVDGQQRDDNHHEEKEAVHSGEEDEFVSTVDVPEMRGQQTRYTDAKDLWRLHLILIETMLPEDIEIKNRVLTQMNWDLLSELESRDQDLLQISTRVQELTNRVAGLQGSNERRRAEKEYLYEVAADLTERLDECEKQRQQLLSNLSNTWAIPSPEDQNHHDEMRRLLDQQNDEIAQLQIAVLDKDEEIKDLAHYLEMAVQAQNELTFELNELILRDKDASPQTTNATCSHPSALPPPPPPLATPSFSPPDPSHPPPPPPQKITQAMDGPTEILNPVKQNQSERVVRNPAAPIHVPPAPTTCHVTSTEEDVAKLKRLLGFPQGAKEPQILVDQGVQVRQRDLDYPPFIIGSYAQRSTFVIMESLIDIEPSLEELYPPSKKLLDAAAVLIRQTMHNETDVSMPPGTSHENLQSVLGQNRDRLTTRFSSEALDLMLSKYIDELAASSGSLSGSTPSNVTPVQPLAFVRRNDQNITENTSDQSRPLGPPFSSLEGDRTDGGHTLWTASSLTEFPEQRSSSAGFATGGVGLPVQKQVNVNRPSRPGRSQEELNRTRLSPLRMITSHSDSMPDTPDLSAFGESPESLRDPSMCSPPTPDTHTLTNAASHSVPFKGFQIKRDTYNGIHDSIDRNSMNAPRISQLMRDIEGFDPSQLASPIGQSIQSSETLQLEALSSLDGVSDVGETNPSIMSSEQTARTMDEHSDTPVRQELKSEPSQSSRSESSHFNTPASSCQDSSSQSTHSTDNPSSLNDDSTDKESNYFYVRVGERYIAIPLSLSDLWAAIKPILPSRHLWWLCVPYLIVLFYMGWTTWLSKEEWYEQNRGYIRANVMERRDRSWQFNEGSTLSKLVIMIFDRIYQPLPPGSYA